MKKIFYFIIIIAVASLFSCKQKQIKVITMNHTRPIEELIQLVLEKGDTAAYDELLIAFMDRTKKESLVYSMFMAHRYHYPSAYFDVYSCLMDASESYGKTVDEETKRIAIEYLKKGAELKNCSSLLALSTLYMKGIYIPKDTVMGKKLTEERRKICGF